MWRIDIRRVVKTIKMDVKCNCFLLGILLRYFGIVLLSLFVYDISWAVL